MTTSIREIGPTETALAYSSMQELRPDLASHDSLVERVNGAQRAEGYRLVGVFVEGQEEAVAVAGFRVQHNLAFGRFLYVDDLVTREACRGQGHAAALVRWLLEEAERQACIQFHLDSYVHRHVAHRFYLNQRMDIVAYHLARTVRVPVLALRER
jgi:GNAT superfamily N-acetyltransferase